MSFLFGSSPELKHVEAATSDLLLGPDWGANLEICDAIKGSQDAGKNYLKAILKRIQHKNPNVAKLGLELLGSTVKNCSKQYHVTLHKQENLNELVKVAKKQGRVCCSSCVIIVFVVVSYCVYTWGHTSHISIFSFPLVLFWLSHYPFVSLSLVPSPL